MKGKALTGIFLGSLLLASFGVRADHCGAQNDQYGSFCSQETSQFACEEWASDPQDCVWVTGDAQCSTTDPGYESFCASETSIYACQEFSEYPQSCVWASTL